MTRLLRLAAFTLLLATTVLAPAAEPAPRRVEFAIVLHGGIVDEPEKLSAAERAEYETPLRRALELGREGLAKGDSSLDVVERVVRFLEDDPQFNAGRGAVFNSAGGHELDASIMDGRNKACGAVGGVTTVKNPVSLARLVMARTRHVLLIGDGAEQFATEMKVERVDPKYFDTEKRRKYWLEVREREAKEAAKKKTPDDYKGTVGCVALDKQGHLAAATSTGGLTNKRYGRVGDSPIIGAGTYADDATCGVSCTGIGEEFIRNAVSYDISAQVRYQGLSVRDAARKVVHETLRPDSGGVIVIGRDGTIAIDFNTGGMSRAFADSTGKSGVLLGKE